MTKTKTTLKNLEITVRSRVKVLAQGWNSEWVRTFPTWRAAWAEVVAAGEEKASCRVWSLGEAKSRASGSWYLDIGGVEEYAEYEALRLEAIRTATFPAREKAALDVVALWYSPSPANKPTWTKMLREAKASEEGIGQLSPGGRFQAHTEMRRDDLSSTLLDWSRAVLEEEGGEDFSEVCRVHQGSEEPEAENPGPAISEFLNNL